MKNKLVNSTFMFLFCSTIAFATCENHTTLECTYNPKPTYDDLILPLPGGLHMVFKKVLVPGAEFWGNSKRLVRIGDIQGDLGDEGMFEGVQRLLAAGSFYDRQEQVWYYYLGKYEVTVNQFVMVMGEGNQAKGLDILYRATYDDTEFIEKLKQALAEHQEAKQWQLLAYPLTAVSWFTYQDFIHQYNLWCYKTKACIDKLPHLPRSFDPNNSDAKQQDMPGFFRLPTELEWEYAARGGITTLSEPAKFEPALPFELTEFDQYVWAKPASGVGEGKPTMIGRLKPIYGFHDLLGNVRELTANWFATEITQGKVGALTVRGGDATMEEKDFRVSRRNELSIYTKRGDKMVETRNNTTGIRLSIGSVVWRSSEHKADIKKQYQDYQQSVRPDTLAGLSNNSDLLQSKVRLQNAERIIEDLAQNNQQLKNQMDSLKKAINDASQKLAAGTLNVCDKLVANAALILKTAGYNYAYALERKDLIEEIKEKLPSITQRSKNIFRAEEQYSELMEAFEKHFANYLQTVEELGGYSRQFIEPALSSHRQQNTGDRAMLAFMDLLEAHILSARQGNLNKPKWKEEVKKLASQKNIFIN